MKTSQNGIDLIKKFEGCELTAYKDAVGIWTIGFGSTGNVRSGQKITQAQAEELLRGDLKRFEVGVDKYVTVDINQNQFDALVSFSYNLGLGSLQKSALLTYVNKKDFASAAKEFERWVKAGGVVLSGLVRRRKAEKELFVTPVKKPTVKLAASTVTFHTVEKGEILGTIAKKYNTTVAAIDKLNTSIKDVDSIRIGQKIRVK